MAKGGDDAAEGEEALINAASLAILLGTRHLLRGNLPCTFTARQVHEVELSRVHQLAPARGPAAAAHLHGEDAMGTTAPRIHPGLGHTPAVLGTPHEVQDLVHRARGHLGEAHATHLAARVLELQFAIACWFKEITELLVVDLQIRDLQGVVLVGVPGQGVHESVGHARHEAAALLGAKLTLHGVGLARARLAIGEGRGFEATEHLLHKRPQRGVEDVFLAAVGGEHIVKAKVVAHLPRGAACAAAHHAHDGYFLPLRGCRHGGNRAHLPLLVVHGP
mmetsp:Transcript_35661/g.77771  ORF Transcript_35661/g.77771 Transcript_35661/m.77771 type:complete len:277 (+) Transcript_35661:2698-3528(+)